jgi:hypothetical protein
MITIIVFREVQRVVDQIREDEESDVKKQIQLVQVSISPIFYV